MTDKRTPDQNKKLWAMLRDVANQVQLCINGRMVWASTEDWKHVFTAALRREQRIAVGLDGGLVFLGQSTRRMTKSEFSDLIEIIYCYGTEHGVVWSEPAMRAYMEYREAA